MTKYLIIPGLGNSGPEHWQSFFENQGGHFLRVKQDDWETPECHAWVSRINEVMADLDPGEVVLIGHSLGCATIAHWAAKGRVIVKGAFLVAPSDVEATHYDFPAKGFSPIPLERMAFPTIVVASQNDPWVSMERARYFATRWGSRFVDLGEAGHINAASGHFHWLEGLELLKTLG